jgi:uncharacterized membrane protein YfhO
MFRANYVLRALMLPAGTHEIVFEFVPDVVHTGALISLSSAILLALIALLMIIGEYRRFSSSNN